ncbi:MAG TPA: alpha/beta hydrolase [Paracoccaceae bacterium]|nr:alpha/beta hydrolase [Paracoccaceae bacterium]
MALARRLTFRGHRVAWEVAGEGPDLVLIHGTPFSSHVWHRIAPVLEARYRVWRFDLLGYGESDKAPEVSLAVQGALWAALHGTWFAGRPAPFVIAHDFGGATALRGHLLHGLAYARLLLVDPVAIRPWGSPFVAHVRDHEAAMAGLPAYIHRAILAAYVRGASHAGLTDAALEPYLAPWLGGNGQAAFYRQIAQMDLRHTDEIEPRLGEIACPVGILWGAEDAWIPLAIGERLAAMIPGARFAAVAGSGHLMQEDAPESILAEALRFFG